MSKATCAVCVTFRIKPEFFAQFLVAVNQQAKNSKELEPWCHQFDVGTSPDQPNTVMLYETYDDRTAFIEKHRTTSHFATFVQLSLTGSNPKNLVFGIFSEVTTPGLRVK